MTYNWSIPRLRKTVKSLNFPADNWELRDTETSFTLNRFLQVNLKEKFVFTYPFIFKPYKIII